MIKLEDDSAICSQRAIKEVWTESKAVNEVRVNR